MQNLLIVHGGGPSAVLNASLYGVIKEAKNREFQRFMERQEEAREF